MYASNNGKKLAAPQILSRIIPGRERITPLRRRESLDDLKLLPIYCDQETNDHVWEQTLELSDCHNLTVYDATYLELALRLSLPLATLDDDLRLAAQQEGVPLLGKKM